MTRSPRHTSSALTWPFKPSGRPTVRLWFVTSDTTPQTRAPMLQVCRQKSQLSHAGGELPVRQVIAPTLNFSSSTNAGVLPRASSLARNELSSVCEVTNRLSALWQWWGGLTDARVQQGPKPRQQAGVARPEKAWSDRFSCGVYCLRHRLR